MHSIHSKKETQQKGPVSHSPQGIILALEGLIRKISGWGIEETVRWQGTTFHREKNKATERNRCPSPWCQQWQRQENPSIPSRLPPFMKLYDHFLSVLLVLWVGLAQVMERLISLRCDYTFSFHSCEVWISASTCPFTGSFCLTIYSLTFIPWIFTEIFTACQSCFRILQMQR